MTTKTTKSIITATIFLGTVLTMSLLTNSYADNNQGQNVSKPWKFEDMPKPPSYNEVRVGYIDKFNEASKSHPNYGNRPPVENMPHEKYKGANKPPAGNADWGTSIKDTAGVTSVYAIQEVHDSGIDLNDGQTLYAPTLQPPNNGALESVTSYRNPSGATGNLYYYKVYNHVNGTFPVEIPIDSNFMSEYTFTENGSDWYYTIVEYVNNEWRVLIYNVNDNVWDLVRAVEDSGPYSLGWDIWEQYNLDGSCPLSIPEIGSRNLLVKDSGSWETVTSTYGSELDENPPCTYDGTWNSQYYDWVVDDW